MTPREVEHAATVSLTHCCEHEQGKCPMISHLEAHTFRAVQAVTIGGATALLLVLDEGQPKTPVRYTVEACAALVAEVIRLANALPPEPPMDPRKN